MKYAQMEPTRRLLWELIDDGTVPATVTVSIDGTALIVAWRASAHAQVRPILARYGLSGEDGSEATEPPTLPDTTPLPTPTHEPAS